MADSTIFFLKNKIALNSPKTSIMKARPTPAPIAIGDASTSTIRSLLPNLAPNTIAIIPIAYD
jgi:hypothetical protein